MPDLTLTLTQQEAQTVLDALAQQPYVIVAAAIAKIQEQAVAQMQPPA